LKQDPGNWGQVATSPRKQKIENRKLKDMLTAVGVLAILLLTLAAAACKSEPTIATHPLMIAGSTSVQPFLEKLAEIYIRIHPEARIEVQGGGSSAGIYACRMGAAQLGASSRELAPEERVLGEIPIAYDGIAVIVHPTNPLNNLGLTALRQIFIGKLTDWRQLGLPPHSIDMITREEGSGTRNAFEELVMGKVEITQAALVQDSNGAVRELVSSDPYAIGYISMGLVDATVKALSIDGVSPTRENVKNHIYKLVRRFLLVCRAAPSGEAKAFIDFILSPQGQKILESEGLVGVKE
jgi:phosphate transport system substrate-binding protein